MAPSRVAITGASGLVGGNLAALLVAEGATVRATKRGASRIDHLSDLAIDWHEAGLEDGDVDKLARAFDGCDAVFHCAAIPTQTRKLDGPHRAANSAGTRNVLVAARKAGVGRFIHCSS